MVTLCDNINACALCICVAQTLKSYSENMKMIEIIRPDVKKCYKTPTIRFVRVEEECILAGGSLDGEGGNPTTDPDSDGDGFAKQSHRIFDDSDSE